MIYIKKTIVGFPPSFYKYKIVIIVNIHILMPLPDNHCYKVFEYLLWAQARSYLYANWEQKCHLFLQFGCKLKLQKCWPFAIVILV